MKKKILYIVNPISGTQRKDSIAEHALALTDRDTYDVQLQFTKYAGHASELAMQAADAGTEIVVAVGGDGTVNEVARALAHTQTALGIVPCGSGNGLARHLRIPMDVAQAVGIINEGVVHALDYGTINNRPFFCTCGVGFDAFISQKFAESGKRGLITYVENTLREGLLYKPQTYTIRDEAGSERRRAFLIAVANASQYGNDAFIAPNASMRDGLFDVVVMKPFNAIDAPQVALQLFSGTLPNNNHVDTFKTESLLIERDSEGAAHCDGEPFLTGRTIEIRMQHKQLNVVVNTHADKSQPRGKSLSQLVPDFFMEWRTLPENLLIKTGEDIKRFNRNVLEKLKARPFKNSDNKGSEE